MRINAALALREKELERELDREGTAHGTWALEDHVVQVLYGVGLALQGPLVQAEQPELRDQLERAVRDIDELVGMLRGDMGRLRRGEPGAGLSDRPDELT